MYVTFVYCFFPLILLLDVIAEIRSGKINIKPSRHFHIPIPFNIMRLGAFILMKENDLLLTSSLKLKEEIHTVIALDPYIDRA